MSRNALYSRILNECRERKKSLTKIISVLLMLLNLLSFPNSNSMNLIMKMNAIEELGVSNNSITIDIVFFFL